MQLHQIDLVPGESIRVGNRIVTLVAVEGNVAQLHVEDLDNGVIHLPHNKEILFLSVTYRPIDLHDESDDVKNVDTLGRC